MNVALETAGHEPAIQKTVPDTKNWKPVDSETLEKVRGLIKPKISYDTYGNCIINIVQLPELIEKNNARAFRQILSELAQTEKSQRLHITVNFSEDQERIYKYVRQNGFHFNSANEKGALVVKCLHDHKEKECTYPAYKTLSVGVTGVVFNEDMTEFVSIQEQKGPYLGPKAMTGTVDYEGPETPLMAAVREVREESNVIVKTGDAVFAAHAWTPDFRNGKPDVNLVFAFCVKKSEQTLKAQATETRNVRWLPVKDFLEMALPVKHNKPLVLKKIVEAAQQALKANPNGHAQKLAWGSGKDTEFYSVLS